ncbi:MAG: TlpA disulfide reductase family protein [Crocinitomicaceae bacterium]|nr:TlpA disulfide reductase family protein [Crocinitomicaceae bacterium]
MIKYLLLACTAALLFVSCDDTVTTEDGTTDEQQSVGENNFTITGEISGAANTMFYLEAQSQSGVISVSEVTSDASGNFEMNGYIPGFGMYQLRMGDDPKQVLLLTMVPNDKLKLTANASTFASAPHAEGTEWAQIMSEYIAKVDVFRIQQAALESMQGQVALETLQAEYMVLKNDMDDFAIKAMKNDPGNPFNVILSTYAIPSTDFESWNPDNLLVLKLVADEFIKNFPESPIPSALSNQINQIDMAYNEFLMNSSGTRVAPEIALKNPDGKEIKLSSLKGKYVMIDFWASWCAPCRRENPNVVALYNKYKNQGFTIYSVSLDNDPIAWKKAIEEDGLVWPNHVSDLLQWNSPLPQLYGFNGIPHTVLLNKEGNIIATGLRGVDLEQKLKEIFEN